MASSKVMPSSTSNSRNSTLSPLLHRHHNHFHSHHLQQPQQQQQQQFLSTLSTSPIMSDFSNSDQHDDKNDDLASPMLTVDGFICDVYGEKPDSNPNPGDEANALLDAEITLIDAAGAISAIESGPEPSIRRQSSDRKTLDDVWREIAAGKEGKVEMPDEMMTLEDFLAKAGASVGVEGEGEDVEVEDVKAAVPLAVPCDSGGGGGGGGMFGTMVSGSGAYSGVVMGEGMMGGFGNGCGGGAGGGVEVVGGRGKRRGGSILEPLDKVAQQRQRRMIKNRESAARSRERKQAYQVELESLAVKLEEENEQLLREKAERTKERYRQLMDKVVPVVEKRKPPRLLRRVRSMQW